MGKSLKYISALLCVVAILLSVFANTGLTVYAQKIEYLNALEVKSIAKDSGSSDYAGINSIVKLEGVSGVEYTNGISVTVARDGENNIGSIALTYDIPNEADAFLSYIDVNKECENSSDYAVRFQVLADGETVYAQTLMPSTEYPVRIDVPVSDAEEMTLKFEDTASNEDETVFILGNAALCESGSSIPAVTIPEEEEETVSTTDINADVQQLMNKSKEYLGHNYLFVTMRLSWEQAATWCEMQGGYLATIESENENKFISDYLKSLGNETAYFGLVNTVTDSELKWQNGEAAKYFNWGRQSVSDEDAKYMKMGGGSDEWTLGAADGEYLNFVIEWGEKEVLTENGSSSRNKAVIIIPGLGGSVLSNSDGDLAWAYKTGTYTELELEDVAGADGITPANSEYGLSDTYKAMIEGVSKVCSDSDVVLYEWDWRNSAIDAVDGLAKLIESGEWEDVALVGHNTGGLAALYYIGEEGSEGVSKVITLGTPFYGTESAYYMMKSGMFAQGTSSIKGVLEDNVSALEALHSLIPAQPQVGTAGFMGELTEVLERDKVFENLDVNRASADSSLLKNVYKTVADGEYGGMYIIAGSGECTVQSVIINDEGDIERVAVTNDGDGLTGVDSAVMNFEAVRPPYILNDMDAIQLVTEEDSIKLVCNILTGKGDMAGYADGVSCEIFRSKQENEDALTEISISGSAKLTVQTEGQTVVLSGSGYSFSGDHRGAFVCGDSVKSVFVTDKAQITIEIQGNDVCFEMSGKNGTVSWSEIAIGSGAVLKTTAGAKTLNVSTDPSNTGLTEIKADEQPEIGKVIEEEIEETDETEENKLVITWNVWVAIGLVVAAAAVALILMPYFAYRVSKVETDRRKRALKRTLRQRRQQGGQTGGGIPQLPTLQGDIAPIDISEVLSGNDEIEFEFLSNN